MDKPLAAPNFSGARLSFHHSVGFRQSFSKTMEHVGEDSFAFLVGRHVGIYECETRGVKYIRTDPKVAQVLTFSVSPNRKYIALSELVIDSAYPQVSVYNVSNLKRVRMLSFEDVGMQPITCLDFSKDSKYLAAATGGMNASGAVEAKIVYWQLDKMRIHCMASIPSIAKFVAVAPSSSSSTPSIAVVAPDSLRLWKFVDGSLKSVPIKNLDKYQHAQFTCQSWYDEDRMAVGTAEGELLVIEAGEVKMSLLSSDVFRTRDKPKDKSDKDREREQPIAFQSVLAIGRGLLVGGDNGMFGVLERTYEGTSYFRVYKYFQTQEAQPIVDISLSPSEEVAIVAYKDNQLASFSLANVDIMEDTPEKRPTNFPIVPIAYHSSSVTGLDLCVQRPYMVSCGSDNTVRVYNFEKKTYEINKQLSDELLCVAIHPMGTMLLVGFRFKLQVYVVLTGDIQPCHEILIKNCKEVHYSRGGQYFAAVCAQNILIFNAYTFELVGHCRGHGGLVRSVSWSKTDKKLVSAGLEGATYEWTLDGPGSEIERTDELVVKQCPYNAIVYDDITRCMVAAGGDSKLRRVRSNAADCEIPLPAGTVVTKMVLSVTSKTLFAGTNKGTILLFRWPFEGPGDAPYDEWQVHQKSVVGLMQSHDERFLFSVSEDLSMFVLRVEAIESGQPLPVREASYSMFEGVAYITKESFDQQVTTIQNLQQRIQEIESDAEMNLKVEKQRANEEIRDLKEAHAKLINELQSKYMGLKGEKAQAQDFLLHKFEEAEKAHMKAAEDVETLYEKKIAELGARIMKLEEEKKAAVVRYEDRMLEMNKEFDLRIQELMQENTLGIQRQQEEYAELQLEYEKAKQFNEEFLLQSDVDYEKQLEEQALLAQKQAEHHVNQYKNAIMQAQKAKSMTTELENRLKEAMRLVDETKAMSEKNESDFKKERAHVIELQEKIKVRDDMITSKDKRIEQLKKQASELEKLRYVLTFKFNELRKEVGPQEDRIKELSERMQEMDAELERVGLDRDALKQSLDHQAEKTETLQRELAKQKRIGDDKERLISVLLRELSELVAEDDTKHVLVCLRDIVLKYNSKIEKGDNVETPGQAEEFARQREHLEQQLGSLKKQSTRKVDHLRADNQRKTLENAALVMEINALRQEKKQLQQKISSLEAQNRDLQAQSRMANLALSQATAPVKTASSSGAPPGTAHSMTMSLRTKTPDSFFASRPNSRSTTGGRLIRGSTVGREMSPPDGRVADMVGQVDRNNREMEKQQAEIQRLRDYVQQLLSVVGDSDSKAKSTAQTTGESELRLPGLSPTQPNGRPLSSGSRTGAPS